MTPPDNSLDSTDTTDTPSDSFSNGGGAPRPDISSTINLRPEEAAAAVDTFDDLPLHERIRESVKKIGWSAPTPVQKLCLPFTLRGRDVAGFAQTGTGKTAVFLLTIVNKLLEAQPAPASTERVPRAIVLAPTRELAMQIEQDAQLIFEHSGLVSMAVFGGIDYDKQARQLKDGVDVIFATPGRLMDYVRKKMVNLEQVSVFVCDEADRMFDMGFIEDVEFFLERIPETSQKLLFSATTNDLVKELAFEYLETPEYISVNPEIITPEKIEQHGLHCHATEKLKVMIGMLREHNPECSIIFTNTKLTAEWLHFKLIGNGIEAELLTGDLPQKKRIKLIQTIKEGKLKALIATDVASRGLHISRVTHVYNFDLPDDPANYVHRIGRTARAGARGFSYSLVCDDYGQNLADIKALLGNQASFTTEWPNPEYLSIEDKAGNPFEERYKAREAEREERARLRDAERNRGRNDRPGQRDGQGGGRGPQQGDGRGRGGRGSEGGRQGQGQGQGQGQQGGNRQGGQRHAGDGRQGQQGQGQGQGRGQQQGRGRNDGQRQGQGQRQDRGGGRPQHSQAAASMHGKELEQTRTFGGMVKKLFKTLFGFGK